MANNSDEMELKENFMAEMVEVRVKMYACKVCGIRYDNMDSMKQHYNEVHPTTMPSEEESKTIKEEILDEDEVQTVTASASDFVLVDEDGQQIQLPEGFQLGENSVILTNTGDNQFLLQVVPRENNDMEDQLIEVARENAEQTIPERRQTRRQTAAAAAAAVASTSNISSKLPSKRGRKRKNPLIEQPKIIPQLGVSTRSKRMVVPNIKSEFVYDNNQTNEEDEELEESGPTYTLIEDDSGIITAYQVSNEESPSKETLPTDNDNEYNENVEDNENVDDNENEDYPADYTPTSKTKKGRQVEPTDDSHLRKFPCPFQGCKYIAKYRSNLWDHKKTHTGEKPYVCNWPSCSMRFSQTHQLKLHLRSHTGERPYECEWPGCNSAFSQKPGLKSHMLTHTGEKPFKCDFPGCGWTFRLKGALTDHKRAIHENAKKHVCEWPGCNKRFLQQCHLKKHIMGHADIKPFACDWPNCNYKAVTMAYVTNHRKIHTGEKNYECTFPNCNKRFVKSSHVNRHRQRCHPELFVVVGDDGDIYDEQEDSEQNDEEMEMNGENYIIEMKKANVEEV